MGQILFDDVDPIDAALVVRRLYVPVLLGICFHWKPARLAWFPALALPYKVKQPVNSF